MSTQAEVQRLMAQIAAMTSQQHQQVPPLSQLGQPQVAPATPAQVADIVEATIKRCMPQLASAIHVMDGFFSKALSAEDFAEFKKYRESGSPGFKELIESNKLHPVAQLLWDEIKSINKK